MAMSGLVLLCLVVVIFLASFLFGGVRGEEFNPETFSRRRFYYYEIPLLRIQIWPLVRNNATGEVEETIQTEKYVTPRTTGQERWDLISFQRSASPSPPFDAAILRQYLEARTDDKSYYWSVWSTKYPDKAKLLWPEVARFARLRLYTLLPNLFEIARTSDDAESFAVDLKKEVVKWLRDYAARRAGRGDGESAAELLREALLVDPENADLKAELAALEKGR